MEIAFTPWKDIDDCPHCLDGRQFAWDRAGRISAAWECPECHGSGKTDDAPVVLELAAD